MAARHEGRARLALIPFSPRPLTYSPKPMPSPRLALALAAFTLSLGLPAARAAEAELPLLRGVLLDGSGNLFCLADATGAATWAKLGQVHAGWKLESFDADRQVLVLSREGVRRELGLETARIQASAAPATVADADALLEKMRFEDMIAKTIEAQQTAAIKAMGRLGGKNLPDAERERMAEFQTKVMKTMIEEMDLPGMRQDMAKAMSEIYTADELRAQSAFYSTPAGQATLEKQPQLQSRMTELMMPRMMKAMPKIQAMTQEHAKAEAAAKAAKNPAPAPATTPAAP